MTLVSSIEEKFVCDVAKSGTFTTIIRANKYCYASWSNLQRSGVSLKSAFKYQMFQQKI